LPNAFEFITSAKLELACANISRVKKSVCVCVVHIVIGFCNL